MECEAVPFWFPFTPVKSADAVIPGSEKDIDEVMQSEMVFVNVSRGEVSYCCCRILERTPPEPLA
jgi:hypothetical protein